jgi:hypothetical protein
MLPAVDTATVSVIVSGVLGAGGLLSPLLLDFRAANRRRIEARDARLDELRSVVDDAATALVKVLDVMPQLEDINRGREAVAEIIPRLRAGLYEVMRQEARLGARLGWAHEVAAEYKAAQGALGEIHTHWSRFAAGEDETSDDLTRPFDEAFAAQGRFFDATSRLIGPNRLPSK